MDLNEDMI